MIGWEAMVAVLWAMMGVIKEGYDGGLRWGAMMETVMGATVS